MLYAYRYTFKKTSSMLWKAYDGVNPEDLATVISIRLKDGGFQNVQLLALSEVADDSFFTFTFSAIVESNQDCYSYGWPNKKVGDMWDAAKPWHGNGVWDKDAWKTYILKNQPALRSNIFSGTFAFELLSVEVIRVESEFYCEWCSKTKKQSQYGGITKHKRGFPFLISRNGVNERKEHIEVCKDCFEKIHAPSEGEDNAFGIGIWE